MLKVQNLTKTFSSGFWPLTPKTEFCAVNDISFEVNPGEILGFLGPNGSGKTTTIQMLLSTLTPTQGSISYFGQQLNNNRTALFKRIGYASGYERLPARLTITENLDIAGRIYGLSNNDRAERIKTLLSTFGLHEKRNTETGALSAGQSTRLMLAKAFLAQPDIVLLDEPTASLDPDAAQDVRSFILEQNKTNKTSILITSHNMSEVAQLCNRVLVLKNGSIIANSTPEQLARSIAQVTVNLTITEGFEALFAHLHNTQQLFTAQNAEISLKLDEHAIAAFLSELARKNINYSHISIDKPTLEDYFLSIAK